MDVTSCGGSARRKLCSSQTTSIHADARGELYLTKTTGVVYHVEAGP